MKIPPQVKSKQTDINKELPTIKIRNTQTEVLIVKPEKFTPELMNSIELNKKVPTIDENKEEILVPILKLDEVKIKEYIPYIQTDVPRITVIPKDLSASGGKIKISRDDQTYEEEVEEPIDEGFFDKEIEEPIDYLGINNERIKDKPIVIFLKDKKSGFIGTLEELCLRIYREIKGGKPKPRKISNIKNFIREIEKWLEAQDKIFTIDFHEDDYKELKNWDVIRDELSQLYGQGVGFILFKNLGLISDKYIPTDHRIKFLFLEPNENLEDDIEAQKFLCSLIWGLIRITDKDFEFNSRLSFDEVFGLAKEKYEIYFDKIREPYITLTKRNKGGRESDDSHFIIKLFLIKIICNTLGYKEIDDLPKMIQIINVEETFDLKTTPYIPDIYVSLGADKFADEAFEVETLFGIGVHAMKKIDETIEKYEKIKPQVKKLNIVMDNLTLLMHLDEIREKQRIHDKLEEVSLRKFDLEFWGLNLAENKLIGFNDFRKKLKMLKNKNFFPIFQNQ